MSLEIEGFFDFDAPPATVYQALQDPGLIRAAMPGGLHFERLSATAFEAAVEIPVPGFGGRYEGTITILRTTPDEFYDLRAEGSGPRRSVSAVGTIRLEPLASDRRTRLHYTGQTDAVGHLNALTRLVVRRIAIELINRGLGRLEDEILRRRGSSSDQSVP